MQGLVSEFFSQCIGKPLDDFEQASARANSVYKRFGLWCGERSRSTNLTMLSLDA